MSTRSRLEETFTSFVGESQDGIRFALVAAHGRERGMEAAAEALTYAWEQWERIEPMANPAGYVYKVGHRIALKQRPERPELAGLFPAVTIEQPDVEPGLPTALEGLTERQRVVVVLVHGFGVTHRETANMLGLSVGSVQRHLDRGLAKLRRSLGVEIDA